MPSDGRIYPRGKCPVCGGDFKLVNEDFICPTDLTRPTRVYIQIKHKGVYSDPKGNPFYSYEHAKTYLNKMRAEIHEKKFELSDYVAGELKPYLFNNFSESWLRIKKQEVETCKKAPSYYKSLLAHVRHHQQPFFKNLDIREINTKKVHQFYLTLRQAPHYVKNILDTLENMLGDAFDWEDIKVMPKFPTVEVPESDIQVIDLDDQDKVIDSINDPMDRGFILFTAREMVRPSETRGLQWSDIDTKHGRVVIRRHFSLNQLRVATKAKQVKHLPLDEEAKKMLESLPRHITSPFVFWKGKQGKPFSESWARKIWKRTCQQFGINISLYPGTRHSSATEAVNRVGVDATQEFLHHTSRAMTKKYAKVNTEGLRKVLRVPDSRQIADAVGDKH